MQSQWNEHYQSKQYFHLEPHDALAGFATKCRQSGAKYLLDLGCGAGSDLLYLAEQGFEVTGVDFSPAAAANAEDLLQSKNLPGKVYVDNLFDSVTTFESAEFDAIVAINSLEYTELPTFQSSLSEVTRILKERGNFLLVVASQETKVELQVDEQLFFKEDQLINIVKNRFKLLDFWQDKRQNYVLSLEKV